MTYGGQATTKSGVHAHEHAIIHTTREPYYVPDEQPLNKVSIRVRPANPQHKLERASRLNYAKVYTVEFNVKVWFIGQVHEESEWYLTAAYNEVHPPLPSRGIHPPLNTTASGSVPGYAVTYSSNPSSSIPLTLTSHTSGGPSSSIPGYGISSVPRSKPSEGATLQGQPKAFDSSIWPSEREPEEDSGESTKEKGKDKGEEPEEEDLYNE